MIQICFVLRGYSFSTYARFSKKLKFWTACCTQVRMRIRGPGEGGGAVRDVNFLENVLYILIEWPLNSPSGEFALHPFWKLNFWFYIQNTICCECNCRYPTIDVIGLMLYRHTYYLKCRRRTKWFLTYGFTCFPWVSTPITI